MKNIIVTYLRKYKKKNKKKKAEENEERMGGHAFDNVGKLHQK